MTVQEKGKSCGIIDRLVLATRNVRGISNKEEELIQQLKKTKINIAVLLVQTKKKMKGTD